nr:hypothetical protein [Tanacetum cinerariifolium]
MGEEFEAVESSGTRNDSSHLSTSSDFTTPLSPDHPLTHISPTPTPTRASFHRRTARMTMRVQPSMSSGHSARVTVVMALSDLAFRKRYRSSYETSSPSLTLRVRKRYRGTSELILDTDSERDELGDKDIEEDENLDEEDKSEGQGLDDEERVSAFRQPILGTWIDPEDGRVYTDVPSYAPPVTPVQTPPSPEWLSSSMPISPSSSLVPSPIASLVATTTTTISVDDDQFIDIRAQLELHGSILHDHTQRLVALPPTLIVDIDRDREQERAIVKFGSLWWPVLALEAWAGYVDTRMTDMSREGYDDHRLVHDMLVQQAIMQCELQEMRVRVTAL